MSSSTTAKKVTARTKARQKIAAQREELVRRQKADEADLADILKALESQDGADDRRSDAIALAKSHYDTAVKKAHADFDDAVAESEVVLGERLAAMRSRGQTVADLAELTELSETDVRRHLKAHKDRSVGESAQPRDDAPVMPTGPTSSESAQPPEALGAEGDRPADPGGTDVSVVAS